MNISDDGKQSQRISIGVSDDEFRDVIKQVRHSIQLKQNEQVKEEVKKVMAHVKPTFKQRIQSAVRSKSKTGNE